MRASSAILLATALICVGCASPGPSRPPSLHLPQFVQNLTAERHGDHVLLRWTTPSRTTDETDVKGPITVELCRETNIGPSSRVTDASGCTPVRRLTVTPGPSEITDLLPPSLQVDPVSLMVYRVQLFNSTGRSAGRSSIAAYAAAGQAPMPILGFRGTLSEQGAILEWQSAATQMGGPANSVSFTRIDLSATPAKEKTEKHVAVAPFGRGKSARPEKGTGEETSEIHLRADDASNAAKNSMAGTVDTTAAVDHTYLYAARRVRTVDIGAQHLELQSDPLAHVTLVIRDTFPPKTPSGLATISFSTAAEPKTGQGEAAHYVDLSWEPNGETDLAGYRVYRQAARPDGSPRGPLARLTPLPIAVPAYRDVAVTAGEGYIYSVTAVDVAGNESAPSAKVLEVFETPR